MTNIEIPLSLDKAIALGIAEREKPALEERLVDAIRKRANNSEGRLVVVSNRTNSSHALLKVREDGGVEATWMEVIRIKENWMDSYIRSEYTNHLLTGHIGFSSIGKYQETGVFEVIKGLISQARRDFEATGGFNYGCDDKTEIPVPHFPAEPYRLFPSNRFEVPLNTVTLLAEHGHVNSVLTQTALQASRRVLAAPVSS